MIELFFNILGQFVGETQCERKPIEVCGAGCTTEEGPEECHDKEVDVVTDVPEEICDLNPKKTCRTATKLVPRLKPKQECSNFPHCPQEVCPLVPLSQLCLNEAQVSLGGLDRRLIAPEPGQAWGLQPQSKVVDVLELALLSFPLCCKTFTPLHRRCASLGQARDTETE